MVSGKYSYYNCRNFVKVSKTLCSGQRIPKEKLETCVINELTDSIFGQHKLENTLKEVYTRYKTNHKEEESRKVELKKSVSTIKSKIQRLIDLVANMENVSFDDVDRKIKELKESKERIEQELKSKQTQAIYTPDLFTDKEFVKFDLMMNDIFTDADAEVKKKVLKLLVKKIVIKGDKVEIYTRMDKVVAFLSTTYQDSSDLMPISTGVW